MANCNVWSFKPKHVISFSLPFHPCCHSQNTSLQVINIIDSIHSLILRGKFGWPFLSPEQLQFSRHSLVILFLFLPLFLCFSLFLSYAAIILNISHLWISDCVSIYSMLSSLRLAVWKLCGAAWNIILEGRGWGRCCERGREGEREEGER